MRLCALAQAWDGYEETRSEEMYIDDYHDNGLIDKCLLRAMHFGSYSRYSRYIRTTSCP
jgi:hypothetical protein